MSTAFADEPAAQRMNPPLLPINPPMPMNPLPLPMNPPRLPMQPMIPADVQDRLERWIHR